jgi:hypothetical protein
MLIHRKSNVRFDAMISNGALFLGWLFFGALFFCIAELFGRSKHIGRYWSWALLWGCFVLPGILAIMFSPSARKKPTEPNNTKILFGFLSLLFALFFLAATVKGYSELDEWSTVGDKMILRMQTSQLICFCILGAYLINLGKGKIINNDPKYYLGEIKIKTPLILNSNHENKDVRYFIVVNGVQSNPLSLESLRKQWIKPETLVWRHGYENWKTAAEVRELNGFLDYQPPPIPVVSEVSIVSDIKAEPVIVELPVIPEKPTKPEIDSENQLADTLNANTIFFLIVGFFLFAGIVIYVSFVSTK